MWDFHLVHRLERKCYEHKLDYILLWLGYQATLLSDCIYWPFTDTICFHRIKNAHHRHAGRRLPLVMTITKRTIINAISYPNRVDNSMLKHRRVTKIHRPSVSAYSLQHLHLLNSSSQSHHVHFTQLIRNPFPMLHVRTSSPMRVNASQSLPSSCCVLFQTRAVAWSRARMTFLGGDTPRSLRECFTF